MRGPRHVLLDHDGQRDCLELLVVQPGSNRTHPIIIQHVSARLAHDEPLGPAIAKTTIAKTAAPADRASAVVQGTFDFRKETRDGVGQAGAPAVVPLGHQPQRVQRIANVQARAHSNHVA